MAGETNDFLDSLPGTPGSAQSMAKYLTPEMVAKLVAPDVAMQQADIEHQRALAEALRKPGQAHSTGMGGMFGAIASGLNGIGAAQKENGAQQHYKDLLGQDQAQRLAMLDLLRQMAGQGAGDVGSTATPGLADQSASMANSEHALYADAIRRKPSPVGTFMPMDAEGGAY